MTKFSSVNDPGYVRVRDQLWLWIEEITVQSAAGSNQAPENSQPRIEYSGTIYSGGGLVIQGAQNAGRDITYHMS
jgi:hypothetical protein